METKFFMNQNYAAFKFAEANHEYIKLLCEPLFHDLNLNVFLYFKLYDDGQYIHLGTHKKYLEYYLANVRNNGYLFHNQLIRANQDIYHYYLWPEIEISDDPIAVALKKFTIQNGFSIYQRGKNFVQSWHFADTLHKIQIKSYYDYHKNLFEKFIVHFSQNTINLVGSIQYSKHIAHYLDNFDIYPKDLPINNIIQENFLNKICPSSHKLELVHLTPREKQCLNLLIKDCSAKEIGQLLDLSHRTVEIYISNIRQKTGFKKSCDLVYHYRHVTQIL